MFDTIISGCALAFESVYSWFYRIFVASGFYSLLFAIILAFLVYRFLISPFMHGVPLSDSAINEMRRSTPPPRPRGLSRRRIKS